MAVGVSCGSTGMQAALDLLEPLLADSVDFVRQGALIATSLVLMQQAESKVVSRPPSTPVKLASSPFCLQQRWSFSSTLRTTATWEAVPKTAACGMRLR